MADTVEYNSHGQRNALLGALAGVAAGFFGSKSKNKQMKGALGNYQPYSGYRPPHVSFLRPVEKQITDILMRRSLGKDVGTSAIPYAGSQGEGVPLSEYYKKAYDIDWNKQKREGEAQRINELSGAGLSRNLAAREATLGRFREDMEGNRERDRLMREAQELETAWQERKAATDALQSLNTFNFGQENNVADFDRSVWAAEQGLGQGDRSAALQAAMNYESPLGSAIESGLGTYGMIEGNRQQSALLQALMGQQNVGKYSNPYQNALENYFKRNQTLTGAAPSSRPLVFSA